MSVRQGSKVIAGNAPISAGFIETFAGSVVPTGWLACDGSAISRTNYADLFAAIGTTYGAGDGSTTFNLPERYAYTGGVIGNGIGIGIETGSQQRGLEIQNTYAFIGAQSAAYGKNVGTAGGTLNTPGTNATTVIGLVTDATKSGIVCEKDNNMIVCIKY